MKTLYTILLIIFTSHLYANKLTWVDEQVAAIKPARVGISNRSVSELRDPFLFLVKHNKRIKRKKFFKKVIRNSSYIKKDYSDRPYFKKLHLEAIFNKSVMINKEWYKEGELVYGYKLIKVNRTSVLLEKRNRKILLSTMSKSNNLKFHNQ